MLIDVARLMENDIYVFNDKEIKQYPVIQKLL
jgi:hypothetical protein